jgi:outer membrane protein OmpA-like peptidoglycan-associated protein
MAEDWAIDVRKYAPDAEDAVIAGIVRHCGIALQSRDASLVSFTDPAETDRVRENFCRKKLGLTHSDAELDAAIARVGERMSGDTTRNRVTVYYLLAEMFGKLGLFGATEVADTPAAPAPVEPRPIMAAAPAPATPAPAAVRPAAAVAPAVAAAATLASSRAHARPREREGGDILGTALVVLGGLAVIIIGAATAGMILGSWRGEAPVVVAAPVAAPTVAVAEAPAPAAPAIPEGSGVVAQDVDGKPQVSVYFDTASAEVSPDFAAAAAPIKAYVDANPGTRLAVSGYNDPRGDAAFNAELSKNRAQSVAAALAALGIPAEAIDLEKPAETTDTSTTFENARRVDIMVKDG